MFPERAERFPVFFMPGGMGLADQRESPGVIPQHGIRVKKTT